MPRAGWCRECERWVWVGEDGECQFGHDASCVDSVHEQPDPAVDPVGEKPELAVDSMPSRPVDSGFGLGELPKDLRRFNWGAFFLPFVWGLVYRSWPVLTAWFVAVISPVLILSMTGPLQDAPLSTMLGASVASEVIAGVCRLWAGLNANAGLWRRDALIREMVPGYRPKNSPDRFAARQKAWAIAGGVAAAVASVAVFPLEATMWRAYGLAYLGASLPIVWMLAEVGLGLWLDARMRQDPPDIEQSAHTLV